MLFVQACDLPATPASTACSTTGNVVLDIYDSQVIRVCGCQEGGNAVFPIGSTTFVCTAKIGTYFSFNFINTTFQHSVIVFSGGPDGTTIYSTPGTTTQVRQALSTGTNLGFIDNVSSVSGTINITN